MTFQDKVTKALKLRQLIEKSAESLTDEEALEGVELFAHWTIGVEYSADERVSYEGVLYKYIGVEPTTAIVGWEPPNAVSLWARVLIPDPGDIPEWEQPISTNAYMMGDKVRHNGLIWISIQDYNVFEPGVAGWEVYVEED